MAPNEKVAHLIRSLALFNQTSVYLIWRKPEDERIKSELNPRDKRDTCSRIPRNYKGAFARLLPASFNGEQTVRSDAIFLLSFILLLFIFS